MFTSFNTLYVSYTDVKVQTLEFDPGSERTLAARLTHASRTKLHLRVNDLVADG